MSREIQVYTAVKALIDAHAERVRADDLFARRTIPALPLFADGESRNVWVGTDFQRQFFTITRIGEQLIVAPIPIVWAGDLEWPEPAEVEDGSFAMDFRRNAHPALSSPDADPLPAVGRNGGGTITTITES